MTLPVWIIPAGCQSQITLVQCRGAKSHVYDMYTGQGVVSSRAVFVYCDLLRLSFDRVFCLSILLTYFNRPILSEKIKEFTHVHTSLRILCDITAMPCIPKYDFATDDLLIRTTIVKS